MAGAGTTGPASGQTSQETDEDVVDVDFEDLE
jgi:hypothetical protein